METLGHVDVLTLRREKFDLFLKLAPEIDEHDFQEKIEQRTGNMLKTIPLFRSLCTKQVGPLSRFDNKKMNLLGTLFKYESFKEGETLYREGDSADKFFIVAQGSVDIVFLSDTEKENEEENDTEKGGTVTLETMERGEFFGEEALAGVERRFATTKVSSNCVLLTLRQKDFRQFLQVAPDLERPIKDMVELRMTGVLKTIPFFANIVENKPWCKMSILSTLFSYQTLEENEFVCRQGENGDRFFVLMKGSLRVTKELKPPKRDSPDWEFDQWRRSATVISHITKPGEFCGEVALVNHSPRVASVITNEHTVLLYITHDKFNVLVQVAPELGRNIRKAIQSYSIGEIVEREEEEQEEGGREDAPTETDEIVTSSDSNNATETENTTLFAVGDDNNIDGDSGDGGVDLSERIAQPV